MTDEQPEVEKYARTRLRGDAGGRLVFAALVYRWGSVFWKRNQAAYAEIMMMSIYVTLNVFLLLASRNPAEWRFPLRRLKSQWRRQS